MNIGGRRITNDDLRVHFEAIGLTEVGVFRASGNVVFAAGGGGAGAGPAAQDAQAAQAALRARIERELGARLGYAVPVFMRTADEVRAIAAAEPLPAADLAASQGKLQVMLLQAAPDAAARQAALALAPDVDRLAFGARELYWLPSGGLLKSALDLKALAGLLGPTTIRTKGTMEQIARKFFA